MCIRDRNKYHCFAAVRKFKYHLCINTSIAFTWVSNTMMPKAVPYITGHGIVHVCPRKMFPAVPKNGMGLNHLIHTYEPLNSHVFGKRKNWKKKRMLEKNMWKIRRTRLGLERPVKLVLIGAICSCFSALWKISIWILPHLVVVQRFLLWIPNSSILPWNVDQVQLHSTFGHRKETKMAQQAAWRFSIFSFPRLVVTLQKIDRQRGACLSFDFWCFFPPNFVCQNGGGSDRLVWPSNWWSLHVCLPIRYIYTHIYIYIPVPYSGVCNTSSALFISPQFGYPLMNQPITPPLMQAPPGNHSTLVGIRWP